MYTSSLQAEEMEEKEQWSAWDEILFGDGDEHNK
jgi:hypothetical protein